MVASPSHDSPILRRTFRVGLSGVAPWVGLVTLLFCPVRIAAAPPERQPIPDKLVVLTFDDSSRSHFTVVRPLLKQHGFGATFFITEGFDFRDNKRDYLTWEEIAQLHRDGFEIGNHSRDHQPVTAQTVGKYEEQLAAIAQACQEHGIPRPVSFAYPGNAIDKAGLDVLARHGLRFARRGGSPEFSYAQGRGVAYEPQLDHPLLIPTAGDARPDWSLEDFIRVAQEARRGRIPVFQFHGVPDTAHAWVSLSPEKFAAMMHYLAENGYRVIALRDLEKYVDPTVTPSDAWGVIQDRQRRLAANLPFDDVRPPRDAADLSYWLGNMRAHGFTLPEMAAAIGLATPEIASALAATPAWPAPPAGKLQVLPYPGGRHPRTGFRDGAIRPQRESKVSVFAPWPASGYVVVDVPEAVWQTTPEGRELLFLAHTHIPTHWDRLGQTLPVQEWERLPDGRLRIERTFPNRVSLGAEVTPAAEEVAFTLWIRNGTPAPLRGLVVQNCVMLSGAPEFAARSNDNKVIRSPFVACRNAVGDRWVITAWSHCVRPWANPPCPCVHSDPQFPDCEPGQTQQLHGRLRFYSGTDIDGELERLGSLWQLAPPRSPGA
ncbi:MAG: polysaccharide deacetylase family protein [Pirellulales bacterium]